MFYYKQSKSSNISLNIKLSEVFERDQGVPNGDERKSEEKSERSPKFRKERLPRINQLLLLDLKQNVLCFPQKKQTNKPLCRWQRPRSQSLQPLRILMPSAACLPSVCTSCTCKASCSQCQMRWYGRLRTASSCRDHQAPWTLYSIKPPILPELTHLSAKR